MDLQTFLIATLTAHLGFAICVTVHAAMTDREAGKWPFLTLLFGLAGVAAYLFYDRDETS